LKVIDWSFLNSIHIGFGIVVSVDGPACNFNSAVRRQSDADLKALEWRIARSVEKSHGGVCPFSEQDRPD
jgi:hypothetical protein